MGSRVRLLSLVGEAGRDADEVDFAEVVPPSSDLARQSVVCGVALLLRDHLKRLYSIT